MVETRENRRQAARTRPEGERELEIEGNVASPPLRTSTRSKKTPQRYLNDEGEEEERNVSLTAQKMKKLPKVKTAPAGETLRERFTGGVEAHRWGDEINSEEEINSDENPGNHGAPGGGDNPGDGDDDGGGGDSGDSDPTTPPGPTRPPPEIEKRIKELERQVGKLGTAVEEIEQFCLSSENVLELRLLKEVEYVGDYITQQGPSMNKTELNLLKRYPNYYEAYSEGCEDLGWLLEQATNMLYSFIARAKNEALFTGIAEEAGKPSNRQARALLDTTYRAIHQLFFILPKLRTKDREKWFSILNQNIDRWERETAPVQRVVTSEGGKDARDANGFPLVTNQMHLGKVISEFSKTVKETIKNGVTNSPGQVSCAQFVITTKHVIRDSMGRIEKIVAQTDIGQTLIAIAKTALTTLDAPLDTDLLFAKDALEGHSSETAQVHSSLPEWLKWLQETFSTTQTLLASAQKVLDATENFPNRSRCYRRNESGRHRRPVARP